jgi:glutathione S-transferase
MPQLRLTYFNVPGRAEPIRVALRLGGVAFDDHRLDFPAFGAAKAAGELPLGSVPMLEVDGEKIVQTGAILRYAAALGGGALYPTDPVVALRVDSALDSLNDTLSHALLPSMFERDMEKKLAMRAELAEGVMKRVLTYVDGLIAQGGGPFVGGQQLTIADLVLALQLLQVQKGGLDGVAPSYLDAWPRLQAQVAAYLAHPAIAALRA